MSASNQKQSESVPKTAEKTQKANFVWTDEETALLVKIIIDYKAAKSNLGLDWETVRMRYEEITERFRDSYPKKESGASHEEFPKFEDTSVITKDRVASKIKRIKTSFRKAVDSGRRSGGGRVVLALYDECHEIWAGCPAVDSISTGIESAALETSVVVQGKLEDSTCTESCSNADDNSDLDSDDELVEDNAKLKKIHNGQSSTSKVTTSKIKDMAASRRSLIQHLKEKKDSKLTKRLSTEAQLLDTAKQEIAMKKRIMESIEESEKKHEQQMKTFTDSMNALTSVIGNGFAMLQGLMQPQVQSNPIQHQNLYQHEYRNQQPRNGRQQSFMAYMEDDF